MTADKGVYMSDTQETTQLSPVKMLDRDDTGTRQGRTENVIAYGVVALVSLAVGFLLGLLF